MNQIPAQSLAYSYTIVNNSDEPIQVKVQFRKLDRAKDLYYFVQAGEKKTKSHTGFYVGACAKTVRIHYVESNVSKCGKYNTLCGNKTIKVTNDTVNGVVKLHNCTF